MTTQLLTLSELSYNGIVFPTYTEVQSIAGRPVYDSAGRTVTHVVWTLNVNATFTVDSTVAENDVGETFVELRQALTKPGGRLHYRDNGFGDFEINTDVADVTWGPRPRVLSWRSPGRQFAIAVNWQVEVAIAECEQGSTGIPLGSQRPPMEYCWSLSHSVDKAGYTVKTINGHVMIAQTRKSVTDRTLSDHADRLRESIEPRCPRGFHPTTRTFNLSEDKCRLDFTFSYEEMPPNMPPAGVVTVKASHSLETPNLAMSVWNGTITATYELPKRASRREAAVHFLDLLRVRLGETRKRAAAAQAAQAQWVGDLLNAVTVFNTVIPTRFSMSENIYDRESATFSLSYMTTLPSGSLPSAIEILGIFQPIPGTDWERWYQSLREVGGPLDPRGNMGLRFNPQDDRLVDLCQNLDTGTPLGPQLPDGNSFKIGGGSDLGDILSAKNIAQHINAFGAELLPKESWLDMRNAMRVEQADNNVEQRLLPVDAMVLGKITQMGTNEPGGGIWVGPKDAPSSVIQHRGKPVIAVILEGRAARAGYAISPPSLNSIGGVEAIPANREGMEYFVSEVATSSIYPVCVASWRLRWILPAVPQVPLVVPVNPFYGSVKTGTGSPPLFIKG